MMFSATGIVETLILLATTFKNDGNGVFGENKQNLQRTSEDCIKRADESFTNFTATFQGDYSRIKRNIEELKNEYVSAC